MTTVMENDQAARDLSPAQKAPPSAGPRRRSGIVVPVLAALALAGLWWLSSAFGGAQAPENRPAVEPSRVVVERAVFQSNYVVNRSFVGRVEPSRVSQVGGELGGRLLEVFVEEGDRVVEGQEIARFDATRLAAQVATLEAEELRQEALLAELRAGPRDEDINAQEAEVRRLRVAAELARATAERVSTALEDEATSAQEWDSARLAAEQAEAAIAVAQANLDELESGTRPERVAAQEAAVEALGAQIAAVQLDVEKAVVRALYDAFVSARFADEGVVLAAGAPLVELRERKEEAGSLEVRVGVLPEFASSLSVGDVIPIRSRGLELEARVLTVRTDRSLSTRTLPILLTPLTPADSPLLDGELIEVLFEQTVETRGAWIPLEALSEGARGLWRCLVATPTQEGDNATHSIVPRTVEVLYFESERAFVRGALRDGELFVRRGTHRLVPGLEVRAEILADEGSAR
ncbi:MAG: biotin/lipoyl-binding protein [Planctomycetota bacterium]